MHRLSRTPDGDFAIIGPYDLELFDEIRKLPPGTLRSTQPRARFSAGPQRSRPPKVWKVAGSYALDVQRIIDARNGIDRDGQAEVLSTALSRLGYYRGRTVALRAEVKRRLQADHGICECEACAAVINTATTENYITDDDGVTLCEGCFDPCG